MLRKRREERARGHFQHHIMVLDSLPVIVSPERLLNNKAQYD